MDLASQLSLSQNKNKTIKRDFWPQKSRLRAFFKGNNKHILTIFNKLARPDPSFPSPTKESNSNGQTH